MEFRLDFFFRIIMDVVFYAINIAFFKLIFLHTNLFGGWTSSEATIFIAAYLVVDALQMVLSANGLYQIIQLINHGDLDYCLVRPVSTLFMTIFKEFAANSVINLFIAAAIMCWALIMHPVSFPLWKLSIFFILLFCGYVLHTLIRLVMTLPTFWTHSGMGLVNLFHASCRFAERPDGIFGDWTRRFLISLLPLCLIASLPCRFLFEEKRWDIVMYTFLIVGSFGYFTKLLWQNGLRAYSSASS